MDFQYTKDKQAEKEIIETIPFLKVTNNIKYLGVTKEVKDMYDKNFKSLKKERRSQKMERSLMLMDWQDQCSKNGLSCQKQSTDSMQSPSKFQLNSSMN